MTRRLVSHLEKILMRLYVGTTILRPSLISNSVQCQRRRRRRKSETFLYRLPQNWRRADFSCHLREEEGEKSQSPPRRAVCHVPPNTKYTYPTSERAALPAPNGGTNTAQHRSKTKCIEDLYSQKTSQKSKGRVNVCQSTSFD